TGDSCLVELLPLPSRNVNAWRYYSKYSMTIPFLKSRRVFAKHVRPKRVAHLKRKIKKYRPKAVVFYGKGNWKHYRKITDVKFRSTKIDGVKIGKSETTLFILAKHPALIGAKDDDFHEIGRIIVRRAVGLGRE